MTTVDAYTEFCRTAMERAERKAAAFTRRDRYGCCDHGGENQYVVEIVTYGEGGRLISSVVEVRCRLDGRPCPSGQLGLLVALYGLINGRRLADGDERQGGGEGGAAWSDPA